MSEAVRLRAKLAKDEELNGLDAMAKSIADNPRTVFAYVWLTFPHTDVNNETGERTPVAMIKRIEPETDRARGCSAVRDQPGR